jgi:hypothetical protein
MKLEVLILEILCLIDGHHSQLRAQLLGNNLGILCLIILLHPLQLPERNKRDWFEID